MSGRGAPTTALAARVKREYSHEHESTDSEDDEDDRLPLSSTPVTGTPPRGLKGEILEEESPRLKRPVNSFLLYSSENRAHVREKHPDVGNKEISKLLGEMWKSLPASSKQPYIDRAKAIRSDFMRRNPSFRYTCKRRKVSPPCLSPPCSSPGDISPYSSSSEPSSPTLSPRASKVELSSKGTRTTLFTGPCPVFMPSRGMERLGGRADGAVTVDAKELVMELTKVRQKSARVSVSLRKTGRWTAHSQPLIVKRRLTRSKSSGSRRHSRRMSKSSKESDSETEDESDIDDVELETEPLSIRSTTSEVGTTYGPQGVAEQGVRQMEEEELLDEEDGMQEMEEEELMDEEGEGEKRVHGMDQVTSPDLMVTDADHSLSNVVQVEQTMDGDDAPHCNISPLWSAPFDPLLSHIHRQHRTEREPLFQEAFMTTSELDEIPRDLDPGQHSPRAPTKRYISLSWPERDAPPTEANPPRSGLRRVKLSTRIAPSKSVQTEQSCSLLL